jgi:cytochrome c
MKGHSARAVRCAGIIAVALVLSTVAHAGGTEPSEAKLLSAGRALYIEGRNAGGAPLSATRAGAISVSGLEAACANCHRRSGFGGSEGRSYIPPIDAASLFEPKAPGTGASATGIGRPAYSSKSLARAIRSGIDPTGRRLDYLMPRYRLNDADMASLVDYLRRLPSRQVAAGDTDPLAFASVVAPGTEPARIKAMTDVLQACVDDHNGGAAPKRGRKLLASSVNMREPQPWKLHVWQLEGAPETWSRQLAERARTQPVFALVGGLGRGTWAPVDEFCEAGGLPCLFPRVEAPTSGQSGFYSLYASRGTLLEADIIAHHLAEAGAAVKRVMQILREDDEAARAAAAELHRALAGRGIEVWEGLAEEADRQPHDALVLWLRGDDLKRLDGRWSASPVYLSATLADLERSPLAEAWKARAYIAYPFELPEKREARMGELRAWLATRGLAVVDEPVQADAYLACSALQVGMKQVGDLLHRDYLLERLEVLIERSGFSGLYPRLTLGAGQRFASNSGYLVRFADAHSRQFVAVGERIAP